MFLAMIAPLGSDITSRCEGRQSHKTSKVPVKKGHIKQKKTESCLTPTAARAKHEQFIYNGCHGDAVLARHDGLK